ncbi:MAG: single-stranded DNA-binding protein [Elusimicrobia bacterium]|nr:MAG: single-stranded DNA-binding protein [Elusimicrobiota bacterium]
MDPIKISRGLVRDLKPKRFKPPVAFVYNPLDYARRPHELFLGKWGLGPREVLLLGMNPGPFGMAQTGVPFGEVSMVRDWIGIEAAVGKPVREHPKRLIEGFACPRREVSGARLWGWAKERFKTPKKFFSRFFVLNYCPLVFVAEGGKNITPDKLPKSEREPLLDLCDDALRAAVAYYRPKWVIGIGAWAEKRARLALGDNGPRIGTILHPSPASPMANRGWAPQAEQGFAKLGIRL